MAFKDIFNKIKEENQKLKQKQNINIEEDRPDKFVFSKKIKDSSFEANINLDNLDKNKNTKNFYEIKKNDTLKSVAKLFYNDEKKWIMVHLANQDKIKNPLKLIENTKIYIPNEGEFDNFYPEYDNEHNYIIQEGDNIKTISEKIFGNSKFYKKLIDWNFFKKPEDIYPSKVVYGLKYKSYDYQINNINKKYFNLNEDNKTILTKFLIILSKKYNLSPCPILVISNLEDNFLKSENVNIDSEYWGILQVSEKKYLNYFPNIAFSIEENINFALENIRKIKSEAKNWPKTIVNYFLLEGIGKGKPEIQQNKAKEALLIMEQLLIKMDNMNIRELEKKFPDLNNENNINFSLLYKELLDYSNFIKDKYF